METQLLERLGLAKSEIKVYLALLELGNTTSGPLILKANVARSKVYETLEHLKEKGLVTEEVRDDIRHFQACSPQKILDYLQRKKEELAREERQFQQLLPQLLAIHATPQRTQELRLYEGYEGIRTFYEELLEALTAEDEYLAITVPGSTWDDPGLENFFFRFHASRAEKGAKARIIMMGAFHMKMDLSRTGNYALRRTDHVLPSGVMIMRDTVGLLHWERPARMYVIKNEQIATQYRAFFNAEWKKAKTLQ